MKRTPPCKECKFRRTGCHSSCELYRHWRERKTEEDKEIRYEKMKQDEATTYRVEQVYEWHKIRKR